MTKSEEISIVVEDTIKVINKFRKTYSNPENLETVRSEFEARLDNVIFMECEKNGINEAYIRDVMGCLHPRRRT